MYSVIYNRESEKDQKIIWDHTHSNAYYDKNALISTNKTLNLSNINLLHSKAYDCKKKKKKNVSLERVEKMSPSSKGGDGEKMRKM